MTQIDPHNREVLDQLDAVKELTRVMIGCAEKSEWEQLGHYETERRKKIETIFAHAIESDISEEVAVAVTQIIADDKFILDRVSQYKGELFKDLASINSKQKMSNAYAQVRDGDVA